MARFLRVQQEFDWALYLQERFTVKPTPGGELRINCVNCDDTKFKLYVNPERRQFCCFKCSFTSGKFDTFDFVSRAEGITVAQAIIRVVREYAEVTPVDPQDALHRDEYVAPIHAVIKTLDGLPAAARPLIHNLGDAAPFWDYLTHRGVTAAEIRAVRFHYIPDQVCALHDSNGKYRGDVGRRLLVPIYGGYNSLVSWQARVIDPSYPGHDKYITAPESELAKTVWPYVPPYANHAVLVEGVLDALSVRRCPEVSAYATFTKKISQEQIQKLKEWGVEEVTLFWDKKDALTEIKKAVPDLHMHFKKVYVCWMWDWPKTQDAGNLLTADDGVAKLQRALSERVDTYDGLEFGKWAVTWASQ